MTGCFLQECVETQNLGKAQALAALPRAAPLKEMIFKNGVKNIQAAGYNGAGTIYISDFAVKIPETT